MNRSLRSRTLSAIAVLGGWASLVGLAGLAGCARAPELPRPRGILLIVLDCLRADHLGAHGSRWPASPRLDQLAAESSLFETAWSQASWTRPSLPSLLTGLYPSEHGLTDSFDGERSKLSVRALPDEAETLAEGLAAQGYRTAVLGEQVQISQTFNIAQGFEEFRNKLGKAPSIRRRFGLWLGEAPGKPFFAYLHFLDLHWPYCPKETFGTFDGGAESRNFCGNWRTLGDRLASGEEKLSERDLAALRARYAEQLLELDLELGRLFDELRAGGSWDETLVVVTSDHGEELFEHGGFRHGHTLYEELVRVPFIWKLPRSWDRPGGARIPGLVETRSLAPTLLAAAGAKVPERISAPSLLPWLLGREQKRAPAELAVSESNGIFAVRDARFKLIVDTNQKRRQLFDLVADPAESNDLAGAEPRRLAELERGLREWRRGLQPLPRKQGAEVDAAQVDELRALGYIQ